MVRRAQGRPRGVGLGRKRRAPGSPGGELTGGPGAGGASEVGPILSPSGIRSGGAVIRAAHRAKRSNSTTWHQAPRPTTK
eukprot:14426691-Alexandrium_andersonii.AAC.1